MAMAMLRVVGLIVVSLCTFVPAFATPVRLSSPDGAYSNVIQTGGPRTNERSHIDRPPRTERPSGDLLNAYKKHPGPNNDIPTALWGKDQADAPLEVKKNKKV